MILPPSVIRVCPGGSPGRQVQEGLLGLGDVCLLRALGLDVPSLGFTKAMGERALAGGLPSFPSAAGTFAELRGGAVWVPASVDPSVTSRQSFGMGEGGSLRAPFLQRGGSSTPCVLSVAKAQRDCWFVFLHLWTWVKYTRGTPSSP